jgi:hypothetical protein
MRITSYFLRYYLYKYLDAKMENKINKDWPPLENFNYKTIIHMTQCVYEKGEKNGKHVENVKNDENERTENHAEYHENEEKE